MRDDPIVYEDWIVGYSGFFNFNKTKIADLGFSLLYCLVNFYVGLVYEVGFMVFAWLFSFLILFIIEGVVGQRSNSAWDRIIILVSLVTVTYLATPDFIINSEDSLILTVNYLSGLALAGKLLLIPISVSTINLAENILVPKSDEVRLKLQDQVDRLASTNYRMDDQIQFDLSLSEFRTNVYRPYGFTFIIVLPLILLQLSGILILGEIAEYILLSIIFISGLFTSVILFIWIMENRKLRKIINAAQPSNQYSEVQYTQ